MGCSMRIGRCCGPSCEAPRVESQDLAAARSLVRSLFGPLVLDVAPRFRHRQQTSMWLSIATLERLQRVITRSRAIEADISPPAI
jgi:hypothetical protein